MRVMLRKFEAKDAELLAKESVDPAAAEQLEWAAVNEEAGPAYTGYIKKFKVKSLKCKIEEEESSKLKVKSEKFKIEEEEIILGCAGIRMIRPGVGEVWAVFSNKINTHRKELFRAVRDMLNILIEDFSPEFTKLRASSRIGFEASQRLLEHLGFERARRRWNGHYIYVKRINAQHSTSNVQLLSETAEVK